MIPKVKTGILTKLPHLDGKSKEEAEAFLQNIEHDDAYSMHQINGDWYLELSKNHDEDAKEEDNTVAAGYSLKNMNEFSNSIKKLVEYYCPDFYNDLGDWCNPRVYHFTGYWKDIEICYSKFVKLIDD